MFIGEWGRCNGQAPQSTKSFMAPCPSAFQPFAQSDHLDGVTLRSPSISSWQPQPQIMQRYSQLLLICGQMVIPSHTTPASMILHGRNVPLALVSLYICSCELLHIKQEKMSGDSLIIH